MKIKNKVNSLYKRYGTREPFEIAERLNILIIQEDLGTLNGYYNKQLRQKQIHINQVLSRHEQSFTCAHELGHAVLHPDASTPFLSRNTLLSVNKLEIEANRFAIELLVSDETIYEYQNYTIDQISRALGYHRKLIELKLNK